MVRVGDRGLRKVFVLFLDKGIWIYWGEKLEIYKLKDRKRWDLEFSGWR